MTMDSKLVWLPDSEYGYLLGRIVDIGQNQNVKVQLANSENERIHGAGSRPFESRCVEIDSKLVIPAEGDLNADFDDNCSLMSLDEASLLHNIHVRYLRNKIYTFTANILIAINPYENMNNSLYANDVLRSYQGKSLGKLAPHVYAIGEKAYSDMKRTGQCQSIIVSGESGAGKTESTKHILRYLCESYNQHSTVGAQQIEQLILRATPLLEAFGNAKTQRNNNSSRFGKFIEIYFDRAKSNCALAGCHILHYLLEKSRICGQTNESERNYHIFYQLCLGLDDKQWNRLKLGPPDKFHYLNRGCTQYFVTSSDDKQVPANRKSATHLASGSLRDLIVNDLSDFRAMDEAFNDFGVSPQEKANIYQVVAAILHLGNVRFEESVDDTRGGCRICSDAQTQDALSNVAELLEIEKDSLQRCLQTRIMQTAKGGVKGSVYNVPLKVHEAVNARDALAKAIYSRLFDYIVMRIINQRLPNQFSNGATASSSSTSIGILDIAGFEYFLTNSFEQFCINYCNEKLQQFFNTRILRDEQSLYDAEGLGVKRIDYVDNADCVELFETKKTGIFDLLKEESRLPRANSQHFTEMVHQHNAKHFRLDIPRKSKLKHYQKLRDDEGFLIKHFAGAVCYETGSFLEKNNDTLHTSLAFLMLESKNGLLLNLFQEPSSASSATGSAGLVQINGGQSGHIDKHVRLASQSVGCKFRSQLEDLINKLKSTNTHFIRCLKPNLKMVPKNFDGACILSQLKCLGMDLVLKLMENGYPSRALYSHIHQLYAPYMSKTKFSSLPPRQFVQLLAKALGLAKKNDVCFGVTKVFFGPGKFSVFDSLLKDDPQSLGMLIQQMNKWLVRSRFRRLQYSVLAVIKAKNLIIQRQQMVVLLQKNWRMAIVRRAYRPLFRARRELDNLRGHLEKLFPLLESNQKIATDIRPKIDNLLVTIEESKVKHFSRPLLSQNEIENILRELSSRIDSIQAELNDKFKKEEEERLLKIQRELEKKREEDRRIREEQLQKQRDEDERRKRDTETMRRQKTQLEERNRVRIEQEEKVRLAQEASTAMDSLSITTEERNRQIEEYKRYQQEKRDSELAQRLASGESPQGSRYFIDSSSMDSGYVSPSEQKDQVSSWNFAQIRDTINTSTDIELLEICRKEFHRRLKVYQKWKYDKQNNSSRSSMRRSSHNASTNAALSLNGDESIQRAPEAMLASFYNNPDVHKFLVDDRSNEQRYFRCPFSKDTHGKGMWYAHFDGPYICRQMEIHPQKEPILLVAGKDDLKMCELTLEETGLTRKRGVEILNEEFESEWKRNGGDSYHRQATGHGANGRNNNTAPKLTEL